YTGVLYDALGASTFTRAGRARADARLWIGSALFGAVRASDPIPSYRLSGGSSIPNFGTLRAHWKPRLSEALLTEAEGIVVDLRSGTYQQLGPIPGAITATVLTEKPDGSRSVVSHFNKHHKGLLARALTLTTAEPKDVKAVARVASKAGLRVEVASDTELIVLTE
ncbi:MAG: peroxide stress protein YaaA, partial [Rhodococcus sp. (in: high G+C Gram-positive bacteria)]